MKHGKLTFTGYARNATKIDRREILRLRTYQRQVIAGALFAMFLAALRYDNSRHVSIALAPVLEAASFLSCAIGLASGGRALTAKFEAFGSDKRRAIDNKNYMEDRRSMQLTAALATASVWSLLAGRWSFGVWTALPLFIGLLLISSLVNRVSGWIAS